MVVEVVVEVVAGDHLRAGGSLTSREPKTSSLKTSFQEKFSCEMSQAFLTLNAQGRRIRGRLWLLTFQICVCLQRSESADTNYYYRID